MRRIETMRENKNDRRETKRFSERRVSQNFSKLLHQKPQNLLQTSS
jgi:hypothetical protein